MMNKETLANDPINSVVLNDDVMEFHNGITKREYFSAMAMQGYLSNSKHNNSSSLCIALFSVIMADELIKELNKK